MKNYALEIKWGVLFMVAMLLWMVLERLAGLHSTHIDQHPIWTNLFAIIAISIYVLALRQKRSQLNGAMTWQQGFLSGLVITIVVTLLTPLGQYLTHTFITPHFFTNAIDYAVANDKMSRADAVTYFSLDSYLLQAVIGALVMGIITSAVVAWFVRKPPVQE